MGRIINNKRFMYSLCSTFVFGLLAHAFRYFNMAFTHDSVYHLTERTLDYQLQLGRFVQYFYVPLRNIYGAPWLIGLLSLIYVAIAVYLLICLFDIQNENIIVLTAGIFATNYTLILINASFNFTADTYMLSVVLYVLAAYLVIKYKFGWILGSICIAVGLGLYQAFLPMAGLIVLFYILIESFDNNAVVKQIILGIKFVFTMICAAILYKVGLWISVTGTGKELSGSYNGIAAVGDYSGYNIGELLVETYLYPLRFFLRITSYNLQYVRFASILLMGIWVLSIILIIAKKNISILNKFVVGICILMLPLIMNFVYFISKGMLHDLMIYHFFMIYFMVLLVVDYVNQQKIIDNYQIRKWINRICFILIGVVLYNNVVYANDVYLKKQLVYENTVSVFNRIIDRIEQIDGYEVNQENELVFIGSLNNSILNRNGNEYECFDQHGLDANFATTHPKTYKGFVHDILNYPITYAEADVVEIYSQKEKVINMPVFPYDGSIQIIDGKIVVKLSD